MFKLRKALHQLLWMVIVFLIILIFSRYERDLLFSLMAGVSSFLILKIIYSDYFQYVFNKRRYALSLLRFIFLMLIPIRRIFGEVKGNYVFAIFVPFVFCLLSREYLGLLLSFVGVILFVVFRKDASKSGN